jgi:hypothetical protein
MVTAPEMRICACSSVMHETKPGSGLYWCGNCDRTQVGERNLHPKSCHLGPQGRIPTEADGRYELAWARRTQHDFDLK